MNWETKIEERLAKLEALTAGSGLDATVGEPEQKKARKPRVISSKEKAKE